MNSSIRLQSKFHPTRFKQASVWQAAIIVILLASATFLGIQSLRAATYAVPQEAETVQPVGNASVVDDAEASGGKVVRFGGAATVVSAPTNVVARTGGNSIALIWDLPASGSSSTEVFRNGTKVATITPGTGVIRSDKLGTRYIDKSVTRGTTYQYQVRTVGQGGQISALTTAISATHPTNTTPVPTVTIDAAQATDLTDYLTNQAKPEIETWYSKISDTLAYPSYTPINSMRLFMDSSFTGVAEAYRDTRTIRVNPAWLRNNLEDGGGMFLHEAVHIMQAYTGNVPFWAQEGVADWVRDWYTRERYQKHIPLMTSKLASGYSEGAYAIQWMETKYSPGITRKLNIALHNGTYTDSFVPNLTGGKTPEQIYAEAQAAHVGPKGQLRVSNGCIDVKDASPADGAVLQILTCSTSSPSQKWTATYIDAGLNGTKKSIIRFVNTDLTPNNRCIYGFLDNTRATSASGCRNSVQEMWTKGSNNSLVQASTGRCLTGLLNSEVTIAACNGGTSQSWTLP